MVWFLHSFTPSLHVEYKGTRIKQYHKEGRALRTETTISNAEDFLCWQAATRLARFAVHWLSRQPSPLEGRTIQELGRYQMTYQVRRLRVHGIFERIPQSHRYRVIDSGLRTALFFTRIYARILRPGLAQALPEIACANTSLRTCFNKLQP
jgi:hypothetical protein